MTDHAELRRLAEAAIAWEGDVDDGVSGYWRMSRPYSFTIEARDASGDRHRVTLDGTTVEPVWSEGDSQIYCECDEQAAYIAAANPQAILALLDELEQWRRIAWKLQVGQMAHEEMDSRAHEGGDGTNEPSA